MENPLYINGRELFTTSQVFSPNKKISFYLTLLPLNSWEFSLDSPFIP